MEKEVFYFCIHPLGDKNHIKVIDLSFSNKYERDEFNPINEENFETQEEAIKYARSLSKKYNLTYDLFEANYHCSVSEKEDEFFLTENERLNL